jgi:hypothetical protein
MAIFSFVQNKFPFQTGVWPAAKFSLSKRTPTVWAWAWALAHAIRINSTYTETV